MSKVRVYEYAKKQNTSSKDVISKLKSLNIEVSNHMSMIDAQTAGKLDSIYNGKSTQSDSKKTSQQLKAQPNSKNSVQKPYSNQTGQRPQSNQTGQRPQSNQTGQRPQSNQTGQRPQSNQTGQRPQSNQTGQRPQSNQTGQKPHSNQTRQSKEFRPNQSKNTNDHQRRSEHTHTNSAPKQRPAGKQRNNEMGQSNHNMKNGTGNHQNKNQQQKNNNKNANRNRKDNVSNKNNKQRQRPQQHQPAPQKQKELPEKITFSGSLSLGELAKKLHREPTELIKKLFLLGVIATINQELDKDAIELICTDYGVEVEEEIQIDTTDLEVYFTEENEENLVERPSVVTIMGHVDHGKTTLLDSLRNTKVTAGEAGGITQHIGAYQIVANEKKITFLDTPGHAAFTTMRARGAKVTDITILVVAADDGVMPQTVEAINHAKAAEVPIIVAVNKMDKPTANPDRVMQELTEHGLVPEDWGGDTIFVPISALKGEGIDSLLEMILLVGEVEEFKANPNRNAIGTVIEAQLDKGRGSVATLLVQNGTLKVGDPIVVGSTFGRVRAMVNDVGRRVKEAPPSTPVEITGLNDVPQAGDRFVVFDDEKTARQIGEVRAQEALLASRNESSRVSLDTLFEQMKQGEMKDLNVIVKADVQGSVEALAAALRQIDVEGVNIKIIHTAVGAINESDITLAAASNAIVIGFNVRPDVNAKRAADSENVEVRLHRVIYKAIEEIEAAMKGMLDPEFEEKIIGQAEVRQTFKVSKIGTIAGSYVTDGKITRDSGVRLIRNGIVIYEGVIDALKRFKDDVKEVSQGYECGITIKNFNDVKDEDIIEAFVMEEIERK
ncbi:translation initiation factor IF-2 [Bacillus sp. FJAT-49732]|uniref:Translation initiation factor IF-2 n=1 Tax=Lederbergia citrisecunda TaxID=2833583 RepID=A0A942TN37_9BACI|nr:translation initiation factor IF-2 [Lederbergia citrisecunda]MBS4198997.1 translation initiation factor IF-2 [Lederbergia citrisecunda]